MVLGLVLENFKDEKVIVFKKKRTKQFRRTRGHRQQLTKVRITRITPDRTRITADDLAEEKLQPVEKPAPAPKPKAKAAAPAPAAVAPAKKAAKAKPAKTAAAKPKAVKKPAPAKPKKAKKE
jgi:large subunit ribosomal protein L21